MKKKRLSSMMENGISRSKFTDLPIGERERESQGTEGGGIEREG